MSSGPTRDYILLYVNGKEHRVRDENAFLPLSDYLRYELGACGTKVVCAEGDCGACSVLIGKLSGNELRYKTLNGCIQYMFQLDCSHVITVEGLADNGILNPVQQTMVDCHGAQCGYCTPGFVVALSGLFEECKECKPVSRADIKEALTGNLCRCTGYESIIKAGLSAKADAFTSFNDKYPQAPMVAAFKKHGSEPVRVESKKCVVFNPLDVQSAVEFKRNHEGTLVICGGTDVGVNMNKRGLEAQYLMCITNMRGLDQIEIVGDQLIIGGKVRLRELEKFVRELIPEFYKILWTFGSVQIREAGTIAGNIANGSPIADTLPFLFVMEADVEVMGVHGTRRIPICSLYQGYKKLDMSSDELITRVFIPMPKKEELLKLYKVSRREHLDISSFAAAIRIATKNGGNTNGATEVSSRKDAGAVRISSAQIAYAGVGPTVMRLEKTESFLQGREFTHETFVQAGRIARDEITPISDVRGAKDFRLQLAENILLKFFYETAGERELACQP
jgi:xanthine dehydrogenase small subunit